MTNDDFIQGIAATPLSDQLCLAFADWLEEHGDNDRAEAIRLRCELGQVSEETRKIELHDRYEALLRKHSDEWVEQFGLPLTWDEWVSVFKTSLAETIEWCQTRSNRALRTPTLQPPAGILRSFPYPRPLVSGLPNKANVVNHVIAARKQLLREAGRVPQPGGSLAEGRLLVFHPDASLWDGAAEVETDGFFDADNVPPWDTWMMFHGQEPPKQESDSYGAVLVAWVPPSLVATVDYGIVVNPEECIRWASDVNNKLTRRLRGIGLLG